MKIIPAIDLMNGKVVRLVKGDPNQKTVYSDDPISVAQKWESSGADMIHIVDLDATLGLGTNYTLIKKIIKEVKVPIQVAGGLRNETIISQIVSIVSRIVIGTLAFENKQVLKKLLTEYGDEKIVLAVDHIDGKIVTNGWQKNTGMNLIESMNEFTKMGFSEFLLTNVTKDGTLQGPDLKFLKDACAVNKTNILASGGISTIEDIVNVKQTNAFGVILGKALYENKISIEEAKKIK